MSRTPGRLELVTAPVGGWCDPVTGACYVGPDDAADGEGSAGPTDAAETTDGPAT